ncbi:hypothetical protein T265_15624, partial [Opisthorchis viverrini]
AIIKRTATSDEANLQRLPAGVELGDLTPSQLLRHMQSLACGKSFDDTILKPLWLQSDVPLSLPPLKFVALPLLDSDSFIVAQGLLFLKNIDALYSTTSTQFLIPAKLVSQRYAWPNMQDEIRTWAKQRLDCQTSKTQRHTISPTAIFQLPDSHFRNVHIDLVGRLPPFRGFTHILTCIDRFTRWPMAIPINDLSAKNTARIFVDSWIATFGVPATIITDRGPQFTSTLFHDLKRLRGTDHFRTTAYQPAANGMVERFHRQLKATLIASSSTHWSERLSLIIFSIHNTVKKTWAAQPLNSSSVLPYAFQVKW